MFWLNPENRIEACEVSLCISQSALFLKDTNGHLNWLFDYTITTKFIWTQMMVSIESLFSLLKTGKMYHQYFQFQWKRQKQKNSNFFHPSGPLFSSFTNNTFSKHLAPCISMTEQIHCLLQDVDELLIGSRAPPNSHLQAVPTTQRWWTIFSLQPAVFKNISV